MAGEQEHWWEHGREARQITDHVGARWGRRAEGGARNWNSSVMQRSDEIERSSGSGGASSWLYCRGY